MEYLAAFCFFHVFIKNVAVALPVFPLYNIPARFPRGEFVTILTRLLSVSLPKQN